MSYCVHKFGGTSLLDAERISHAIKLLSKLNKLNKNNHTQIIVVSALGGTTQMLRDLIASAENGEPFDLLLTQISQRHYQAAGLLLKNLDLHANFIEKLEQDFSNIKQILAAINIAGFSAKNQTDLILGYGELWSSELFSSALNSLNFNAVLLDARKVLTVNDTTQPVQLDWDKSQAALNSISNSKLKSNININNTKKIVIPGFVAQNLSGQPTTLGANCSDYSAAIFAKLFHAESLTIWTDVNGVMSANPKQVKDAFPLEYLSYKEALELAYFGASVLHPQAIAPVMEMNIPLKIKNTLNPDAPGSTIGLDNLKNQNQNQNHTHNYTQNTAVKGLSSVENVALLTIQGAGMIGVSGIAARAFSAMQLAEVSVILISQASSEYSICMAVSMAQVNNALQALKNEFVHDLSVGNIEQIKLLKNCCIVAVVGDGMIGSIGLSGKVCDTLASANVNICAIAQGGSERNISLVIKQSDETEALNALHTAFYHSIKSNKLNKSNKKLSIMLIGPGQIGATLLNQIQKAHSRLLETQGIDIQVVGIINSKKMCFNPNGIDLALNHWKTELVEGESAHISQWIEQAKEAQCPNLIMVDTTANSNLADLYSDLFKQGFHLVTANKFANSGDSVRFNTILKQARAHHKYYYYETICGAGLPIFKTLFNLQATGDSIIKIEAVLSGTLSYIFNQMAQGKSFSDSIIKAKQLGYTEPDPRADLSGMDVARKAICLARACGVEAQLDNLLVESLVPKDLQQIDLQLFLDKLADEAHPVSLPLKHNKKGHNILHYTFEMNGSEIKIGVNAFDSAHPFSRLSGTDNMVIIYTNRYQNNPLIIQGPGAGADVTAAGLFSDILDLTVKL